MHLLFYILVGDSPFLKYNVPDACFMLFDISFWPSEHYCILCIYSYKHYWLLKRVSEWSSKWHNKDNVTELPTKPWWWWWICYNDGPRGVHDRVRGCAIGWRLALSLRLLKCLVVIVSRIHVCTNIGIHESSAFIHVTFLLSQYFPITKLTHSCSIT